MNIEETYNIHKKINCVFPFFKSKWLCKKNKHNYEIHSRWIKPKYPMVYFGVINDEVKEKYILETYWKCRCCGKEIKNNER